MATRFLVWVVAAIAVLAGLCFDTKDTLPVYIYLSGLGLLVGAFGLGFWLVRLDRASGNSFWKLTYGGMTLWIVMFTVVSTILGPVFRSARVAASYTRCRSAIKQTALSVLLYASDHDDLLPPARSWRSASAPYGSLKNECPEREARYGYGFNRALSGVSMAEITDPMSTALLFECEATTPDASGGREDVVFRHGYRAPIGRVDGSVHFYTRELRDLRWKR